MQGPLMSPHRVAVRMKWGGSQHSARCEMNALWRRGSLPWMHCYSTSTPPWGKEQTVALKAASSFRRVPGSDPWTRELALCWGLLRRMWCALMDLVTAEATPLKPFGLPSKLDQASDGMTFWGEPQLAKGGSCMHLQGGSQQPMNQ